jgi:hypothetical protein
VAVKVGVGVAVFVGVAVGVSVGVLVGVGVKVGVSVGVLVGVGVSVGVSVGVGVFVGVGVLGRVIAKLSAFEVPPLGVGFTTVILAMLAVTMSVARIEAFNSVDETYVVVRLKPFQSTVELTTKLVPLTSRLNAALPTIVELGLRLTRVGTGLLMVSVKLAVAVWLAL